MRPRRRWGRRLLLRSKRAVLKHHLSLVSAAVIVVALAVALTDGSFEVDSGDGASRRPVPANAVAAAGALPREGPETGSVIYYIVESARQMDILHAVRRGESALREYESAPAQPPASVYYLIFDTPQREAAGAKLLHQIAELAPLQGFNLTVVDLTQ